jgi:hypothetical protein
VEYLGQRLRIDARNRDVRTNAENDQSANGEPKAILELGRLTDRAPVQI